MVQALPCHKTQPQNGPATNWALPQTSPYELLFLCLCAPKMERTRHLRPNRGKNPNARWLVEEVVKPKPKRRKAAPPPSPPAEGDTRCRCNGSVSDEHTMAECEGCKTWQHIVCEVGVDDESALPEPYKCSECREPDSPLAEAQLKVEDVHTNGLASSIDDLKDKVRSSVAQAWLHILSKFAQSGVDPTAKAIEIEAELFKAYGGTEPVSQAYREQFRTLSFNLKDSKNLNLQQDVLSGAMPASKFVAMTSEQLRNPELQQMADVIHKESIREAVIPEAEPPKERISTSTAELNAEPSEAVLDNEERRNEEKVAEAMKEPVSLSPKDGEADSGEADSKPVESPVWSGKVLLADNSIEFISSGIQVTGENHTRYLGDQLKVQGLVQLERTMEYLRASAADTKHHRLGSVAILEPQGENSLFDYIKNLQRFGSITTSGVDVKDAFLVPWTTDLDFSFLSQEALNILSQLATERDEKLLVTIYVLNVR